MTDKKLPTSEPEHFLVTPEAEPFLERLFFGNRAIFLVLLLLATVFLGYNATQVGLDSSSEKYIPLEHQYIKNHMVHKNDLSSGLSNVKIVVASKTGEDIFTAEYMETLRQINDDVFFVNGVNRSKMK